MTVFSRVVSHSIIQSGDSFKNKMTKASVAWSERITGKVVFCDQREACSFETVGEWSHTKILSQVS